MEDLRGKTFNGYRIIEPLGEGGMAAVYRAYQPSVDRYVALKVLPQHFAKDATFVERFKREAHVLARLQHPHIVPVYDYGEAEGYTYIVMPLLEAGTLADRLSNEEPLPLPEVKRLMSQIGDALDYAHAQGIIHRDVKPSNVLLDERDNALLTDFGIAKMLEAQQNITVTGGIVGTPAYMSPEQGMGEELDGRSDIYALGVILYELCTGRVPFKAETPMAVMFKHMSDPLPPPKDINPNLPESLERVILKALAKEPENRYSTPAEMAEALQQETSPAAPLPEVDSSPDSATAVAGPDTALSPPPASPTIPSAKSKALPPTWLMAGGGIIILLLIGILGLTLFGSDGSQPPVLTPTQVAALAPVTSEADNSVSNEATPTSEVAAQIPATATPEPTPTEVLPTATPEPTATEAPPTATPSPEPTPTANTVFPLPEAIVSYSNTFAGESFSFRTDLSLSEIALFYELTFAEMGMQELEMMRVLEQGNLNLVFANWPEDGRRVQVTGSDLALTTPDNLRIVILSFQEGLANEVVFPLTQDAQVLTAGVDGEEVIYQSTLSLTEVIDFYRETFSDMGLQELDLYTSITDDVASLIFEGWPDETREVVVQIVNLGASTQNDWRSVSLRFEAVR